MAQTSVDRHGVLSRAGDGTGGQVNSEPIFGITVGVAHRHHFGAHVMAPSRLLIQSSPIGVGRISVHLKAFQLRVSSRVATVISASVGGRLAGVRVGAGGWLTANRFGVHRRCAGARLAQQFIDDVTVGGVGCGDGHGGDQLVVGIDSQMRLVPIEGARV